MPTRYPALVPSAEEFRRERAGGRGPTRFWRAVVVRFDDRLDKGRTVAKCDDAHALARTATACAERLARRLARPTSYHPPFVPQLDGDLYQTCSGPASLATPLDDPEDRESEEDDEGPGPDLNPEGDPTRNGAFG